MTAWVRSRRAIVTDDADGPTLEGKEGNGARSAGAHDTYEQGKPPWNGTVKQSSLVRSAVRLVLPGLLLFCSLGCGSASAAPVSVQYQEGTVHGFLVLKDMKGSVLAYGDLVQIATGSAVKSKTMFTFPDGSYFEEQVAFTQEDVFRMRKYSLIARGPIFEKEWRISLDANTARYSVETKPRGRSDVQALNGDIQIPPDAYNGMVSIIAKNVTKEPNTRVHFVGFTPEPRVVPIELTAQNAEPVMLGNAPRRAVRFLVKPDLGLLPSVAAELLGKMPPDNHLWIMTDELPAFVRADAVMVPDGPVWRIELAVPRWPDAQPIAKSH